MAAEAFFAGCESAKNEASAKGKTLEMQEESAGGAQQSRREGQSRCAACGEIGHWHGDPKCNNNSAAASSSSASPKGAGKGFRRKTNEAMVASLDDVYNAMAVDAELPPQSEQRRA